MQVFYQGIDKVSNAVVKPSPSEDEPLDDPEGETKPEGADTTPAEGEGGTTTDAPEGLPGKDEEEQDEDGGEGEHEEMTDEELAIR